MQPVNRFIADHSGATAIAFALTIVPLIAIAGAAVDYARATSVKADLQRAADATALHLARESLEGRRHDAQAVFTAVLLETGVDVLGTSATAAFVGTHRVQVDATAAVPMTLASFLMPRVDVGVTATAAATQRTTPFEIERANLSVEAADYNELRVYCYHERRDERLGPIDGTTGERLRESLKIADNTDEGVAAAPRTLSLECGPGEALSYHLVNIRHARTSAAARRTNERWDHYTDTTMRGGVAQYNTQYRDLIETIRCRTAEECQPGHPDSIVPGNGQRNRTPAVNTEVCNPGEYMYFGWEDRPPHIGQWTDQDYDDIRVVMRCGGDVLGPISVALVE
ncbi:TadE/TadG family type IV pilus assembly protein [Salinarimonas chemoclinalis]|uniref:TadE/TadG family type IV pilus assembly protein n=1 Tax=Salinarimonas chemoclinalis TaxID=3241599 RepID=UPI003555C5BC